MQRGNLKCDATNCAHNQDYECKAGRIHVSGLGAVSVEGTNCTTFVDRENSIFVNIAGDSTTKPSDIKCEAHNCIYNVNKDCHAEKVQIDELNACCDTFDYGKHV